MLDWLSPNLFGPRPGALREWDRRNVFNKPVWFWRVPIDTDDPSAGSLDYRLYTRRGRWVVMVRYLRKGHFHTSFVAPGGHETSPETVVTFSSKRSALAAARKHHGRVRDVLKGEHAA